MGNTIKKGSKQEISKAYEFKDTLGHGSFGLVKRATRKQDKTDFAVKIIKKERLNADELAVVHDEQEILGKIDHPNVVKLYEIYETPKKIFMVMELLTGGELFDRIVAKGSYSEAEASTLIKNLCSAIEHLHSIGVVHRDLKPENLLYLNSSDSSPIKITDFGLAKHRQAKVPESQWKMNTACGTPGYVAPEVLKNEPYTQAVDMWSVGVILYILLCGFPPFYHENTKQLYKQIMRGAFEFPSPYWDEIGDGARNLVHKLLCVNPNERLTAKQVLVHPWIVGGASTKAFSKEHNKRIKLLQARRRFRKAVQSMIAINKFCTVMEMLKRDDEKSRAFVAQIKQRKKDMQSPRLAN